MDPLFINSSKGEELPQINSNISSEPAKGVIDVFSILSQDLMDLNNAKAITNGVPKIIGARLPIIVNELSWGNVVELELVQDNETVANGELDLDNGVVRFLEGSPFSEKLSAKLSEKTIVVKLGDKIYDEVSVGKPISADALKSLTTLFLIKCAAERILAKEQRSVNTAAAESDSKTGASLRPTSVHSLKTFDIALEKREESMLNVQQFLKHAQIVREQILRQIETESIERKASKDKTDEQVLLEYNRALEAIDRAVVQYALLAKIFYLPPMPPPP